MIHSLNGKLTYSDAATAVVECGGVGFLCNISYTTAQRLPKTGQPVFLLTHMNVREDALDLFGFIDESELAMFRLITQVSGVGPKVALAILSEFTPDKLSIAIASGDHKSITRANGVGPKLAQRIALELRDKVGGIASDNAADVAAAGAVSASSNASDAVMALVALGYSQGEASLAVGRLDSSLPTEMLIKQALRALSRGV